MGLFTTRQLLGYTEQKVKFRALFLELFFRRTVNFHTEEVMLDKITGKTPVAAYVSPVVEGKVLRHRGGETRVLRPGYVKPKHEFNYQQAVERLPGEDPSQLNDPAYDCPGGRNAGGKCCVVWQIHHGRRPVREN